MVQDQERHGHGQRHGDRRPRARLPLQRGLVRAEGRRGHPEPRQRRSRGDGRPRARGAGLTRAEDRHAVEEDAVANTTVRSYTRAVRHPLVLGRVGGYQLPFQLSVPQLIVGAIGVGAALVVRPLLAQVFGSRVALAMVAVAVFGGVVVAKRVRAEGRNSLQALAGLAEYLTGSGPRVHGRRVKTSTRRHARWPTVVPVADLTLPPRPKELARPRDTPARDSGRPKELTA
ncbi:MAG: hypothetical protein GEV08_20220 [Acidimicrobiia bacterium]|nr:hypothetical protein [Acidimicrobiia bacterium]